MEKLTIKHCQDLAELKNGKCLSLDYIYSRDKYLWECKEGHQWWATYNNIRNGRWCAVCARKVKATIEDCHNFALTKGGKCLSDKYIDAHSKMLWECDSGHQWHTTFGKIKNQGRWCPDCGGSKKLTMEDCYKLAELKCGKCLDTVYINAHHKMLWECNKKHRWFSTYNHIQSGTWCPKCVNNKTQKFLLNLIKNIFPNYTIDFNFRGFDWLKYKKKLEIDIFVKEIRLAIEYDGQQHFEPILFNTISPEIAKQKFIDTQKRDLIKNQLINSHSEDVRYFIRFNYKETLTDDYVRNKILSIINFTQ